MNLRLFCFIAWQAIAYPLLSQSLPPVTNGWLLFEEVKFEEKYYAEFDQYFLAPLLDSKIRRYERHEVLLKGHYMPFKLDDKHTMIISKYPYSACYFCGGAGPGSVAEIWFKEKPPRLKADQIVQVSGILKLNDRGVEHMNFILTEAVLITE